MRAQRWRRLAAMIPVLLLALIAANPVVASPVAAEPAADPATPTWSGVQLPSYERYVALGDSYTSGPFVPFQRLDPLGCGRSTNNYPSFLAAALDVETYVDVSCGGARTDHMTAEQAVIAGSNPPQFDALDDEIDLVTIGIGGNDFGVFGELLDVCPALRADDPTGAPCAEHFNQDGVDVMLERIARTEKRVEDVLVGITERAPDADVYVVGYPRIIPVSGTCPDILPFADGDYTYLDGIEQALNEALAAAAERAGVAYVDAFGPSIDHDACGASGRAWIQGQQLNIFWAAPYHPNLYGMAGVAGIGFDAIVGTEPTGAAKARLDRAVAAGLRDADRPPLAAGHQPARQLAAGLRLRQGGPVDEQPVVPFLGR